MLDTIIRGGTIINGTDSPGVNGDIAIANGGNVSVGGRITDSAHEEIDADGGLVTPGFVDFHTHYDLSLPCDHPLISHASAPQPEGLDSLGAHFAAGGDLIFPPSAAFIPGPTLALPSSTLGGSPVRESRPPGSVREAPGNGRPYRDTTLRRFNRRTEIL
jgi:hypothetical protein